MSRRAKILCLASLVLFCGCLRQQGRNDQCRWPDEAAGILNLHNASDQDYLRDDAQFAEELAIRHTDRFRRTHGHIESHQRLVECTGTLFGRIAALHSVNAGVVSQAALQRNKTADFALVFFPMGVVFVLFTYRQCDRIFLQTGSIAAAMILALFTSILATGCGVLNGEEWALAVETLRIGNGHRASEPDA